MLRLIYNGVLFLFVLLCLPKWIWEACFHRKHRRSFLEKLGIKIPSFPSSLSRPRIWIHSISVGETKAIAPLFALIKEKMPKASLIVSTVSETGQEEAKRSLAGADHYFYLPLDFSWTIRRLIKKIDPDLLILVEGDFWFNLIWEAPCIALVNGKISERSLSRFQRVPFFAKPLFQKIDLLCVQSECFVSRFKELGALPSRIVVTGNLKLDQRFPAIDKEKWRQELQIKPQDLVITIGSTHAPEEEELLEALKPLFTQLPTLKILLVPRHPERFSSVATLLHQKGIDFSRFSEHPQESKQVMLIDAMGVLTSCYQLSHLAIVGGSFVSHVGGHNVFEPAAVGVPVLFGPFMEAQKDLVQLTTQAGAGKQVDLAHLASFVSELLADPLPRAWHTMHEAGLRLASEACGSTGRTWQALERLGPLNK